MTIRAKQRNAERVIDLTGPAGNAFSLMGYAMQFSKQMGIDAEPIIAEMKSGDYENLVEVFDKYFGDYVVLER